MDECEKCNRGFFSNGTLDTHLNIECFECTEGKRQSASLTTLFDKCYDCSDGKATESGILKNKHECSYCNNGEMYIGGNGCRKCDAGKYSRPLIAGDDKCYDFVTEDDLIEIFDNRCPKIKSRIAEDSSDPLFPHNIW